MEGSHSFLVAREKSLLQKTPLKNGHGDKTIKVNGIHHHVSPNPIRDLIIGECILYESLLENLSSLLCKWAILQGYHLVIHQSSDAVHVYLNVLSPLYFHCISGHLDYTFIITPNDCG